MADHKTTPWTEEELDDATRRLEAATKAATAATPLNPAPWISSAPDPKPDAPKAIGGLWYHEQQSIETTQQSVRKAAEKEAAFSAWVAEREAARKAAQAADRKAQEAAQEAARKAAAAKKAELAALAAAHARAAAPPPPPPPKKPWRKPIVAGDRWYTSTYVKPRLDPNRKPLPKLTQRQAERAYAALAPTPEQPDVREAAVSPKIRAAMRSREFLVRHLKFDSLQQHSALDRAALLCNRLIENLFPPVNFSDMALVPTGRSLFGSKYPEEDNDE